jgi:hypothetical protein
MLAGQILKCLRLLLPARLDQQGEQPLLHVDRQQHAQRAAVQRAAICGDLLAAVAVPRREKRAQ